MTLKSIQLQALIIASFQRTQVNSNLKLILYFSQSHHSTFPRNPQLRDVGKVAEENAAGTLTSSSLLSTLCL